MSQSSLLCMSRRLIVAWTCCAIPVTGRCFSSFVVVGTLERLRGWMQRNCWNGIQSPGSSLFGRVRASLGTTLSHFMTALSQSTIAFGSWMPVASSLLGRLSLKHCRTWWTTIVSGAMDWQSCYPSRAHILKSQWLVTFHTGTRICGRFHGIQSASLCDWVEGSLEMYMRYVQRLTVLHIQYNYIRTYLCHMACWHTCTYVCMYL